MKNKEQFRMFYSNFWTDGQIQDDFTPEDRYFYFYLLTNMNTSQLGVYEITVSTMSAELGYDKAAIQSMLKRFEDYHKLIAYNRETKELAVLKWAKYNWRRGGKPVWDLVKKEIDEVKDAALIELIAQRAPESWLKTQICAYMNAQGAEIAHEMSSNAQYEEDPLSVDMTGFEDDSANAQDESWYKKEEIINNKKHTRKAQSRTSTEALESAFLEFWELYGKKKDKKRSLSAFKTQAKKHGVEAILNGTKAYLKECEIKGTDKQYIKHPSTFLNGECFNDEYETKAAATKSTAGYGQAPITYSSNAFDMSQLN
jgi:hypothetical protein